MCLTCGAHFHATVDAAKRGFATYCSRRCFAQARRVPLADRFWAKVKRSDGCWLWRGACDSSGYGSLRVDGRTVRASRISWELHHGAIPSAAWVLHNCDVNYPAGDVTYRRCIRPDHLWLGTVAENNDDMVAKSRQVSLPGRLNGRARLRPDQVVEIRARLEHGGATTQQLADEYGVTRTTIRGIETGRLWHALE